MKVYEAIQRRKCAGLQNSIKTDTFNGNLRENPKGFNGERTRKRESTSKTTRTSKIIIDFKTQVFFALIGRSPASSLRASCLEFTGTSV